MSSGGLNTRIREMDSRGYRVHSRGTHVAVLTRGPQRTRSLARLTGLGLSLAALLFGIWRASRPFVALGLVTAVLVGIDWWSGSKSMTVRLTVDDSGRVRDQLIRLREKS